MEKEESMTADKSILECKKNKCSISNIFSCSILIIILAIFCILELAVLGLIFSTFMIFYIAIIAAGSVYIVYKSIIMLLKKMNEKKSKEI